MYHPPDGWWLLVTTLDETSPVSPGTLLVCIENLRTLLEFDTKLGFNLVEINRRKNPQSLLVGSKAIIFYRQAKIRILDKNVCSFETSVTVLEALHGLRLCKYKHGRTLAALRDMARPQVPHCLVTRPTLQNLTVTNLVTLSLWRKSEKR